MEYGTLAHTEDVGRVGLGNKALKVQHECILVKK
jgi:hypothetical protein